MKASIMVRPSLTSFVASFACLTLLGCGPSASDVIDEFRADYATYSASLESMLDQIPDGVVADQPIGNPLQPAMVLMPDGAGNTECIALEKLRDPDANVDLDLYLDMELSPALTWMQPDRSPSGGDAEFMRKTLQTALDLDYLVVYRTSNYVAARVIDETKFIPATIDFELFIFSVGEEKLVGVTHFKAETPDDVTVFVRSDEDAKDGMSASIKSALYENAREKFAETLTDFAKATVQYD